MEKPTIYDNLGTSGERKETEKKKQKKEKCTTFDFVANHCRR